MNYTQSDNRILNVYLFYGENKEIETSSRWCLGFNCDTPLEIISELNCYRFVNAVDNPSQWKDKYGRQYNVVMLLGDNNEALFNKRKDSSREAIEEVTGEKVALIEVE